MERFGTGVRTLALTLLGAVALALLESAPGDAGWPWPERLRFFLGIDLIFAGILGTVTATAGAMLVAPKASRWTWPALAVCVLLLVTEVALLAKGLGSGLSATQSWRASTPLPALASPNARSVVLISVDTWRADSLPHMPLLQARAEQAQVYQRALSTSSWTLPAMASLMTGLPVHEHGAGRRAHPTQTGVRTGISPTVPTLPERLREQGYVSVGVLSNPYLGANMGFHRGLDRAVDTSRQALLFAQLRRSFLLRGLLPTRDDDAASLVALAQERWGRLSEGRSFLWVHLSDAHAPYGTPEDADCEMPGCFESWVPARRGAKQPDPAQIEALYRQDLAELDRALDALLAEIDTTRTLVVMVGDHGEAFGPAPDVEHGHSFAPAITQVPLLVWGPGIAAGPVERSVNLMDVHQGVLDYAERGRAVALDPAGPDSLTPMASLLFGPDASACSDGHSWLLDQGPSQTLIAGPPSDALAGCIPGPLPEGAPLDMDGALLSLGYIE